MARVLIFCLSLLLCSCAGSSRSLTTAESPVVLPSGPLYIVPFETVMVPDEVSAGLFDLFVDRLNDRGGPQGMEFIILKPGLARIDAEWLATRTYLTGDIFAYIEEVGSSMTDIKARSRVRLYRPGSSAAVLQLTFPTEVFYQNDYSSLAIERRKLAEKIALTLADRFLAAITVAGND
ncbi:MAG: hypothetical protein GXP51_09810 [Deltaproteobacteria bacterium]|nr:hypothetical protein [Deltaproteobacteria bacterium]